LSLKVAIVGPEFPLSTGGESEYAAQVASGLHRRGHKVVVFTRKENAGRGEGYDVRNVLEAKHSCDRQIMYQLSAFDVVHVLNSAWCWVAVLGKPTFLSIYGNDFINPNPVYGYDIKTRLGLPKGDRLDFWLAVRRTRAMMLRCLPMCRRVFAISDYTKNAFLQRYPACHGRVIKAGIGVSARFIESPVSFRMKTSAERLLTVCRLSEPRKNVDLVLRALGRLKSEFPFSYTIVGEGNLRRDLETLSLELGIADRVQFAGRVADADLISYYQGTDLFVMPSGISETSFEGFGIVYLEANAVGVPTLAVRAGGAQEAVREGRSGFFIEEATVPAIENGLRSFLSGKRTFRSEDCRQFAAEFTWDRVIDKFEQTYKTEVWPAH
jgi:glycosyltransferase involved in cell wall biosynthesis